MVPVPGQRRVTIDPGRPSRGTHRRGGCSITLNTVVRITFIVLTPPPKKKHFNNCVPAFICFYPLHEVNGVRSYD